MNDERNIEFLRLTVERPKVSGIESFFSYACINYRGMEATLFDGSVKFINGELDILQRQRG
jgi:hypothetical protein